MSDYKAEVAAVCIAAVIIAGVATGHDGYLLLTGVGTLSALGGYHVARARAKRKALAPLVMERST